MSTKKIAPILRGIVNAGVVCLHDGCKGSGCDVARRELRDLLAVARAAKSYKNREGIVLIRDGRDVREGKRLIDALSRLSRPSRSSRGGR